MIRWLTIEEGYMLARRACYVQLVVSFMWFAYAVEEKGAPAPAPPPARRPPR